MRRLALPEDLLLEGGDGVGLIFFFFSMDLIYIVMTIILHSR